MSLHVFEWPGEPPPHGPGEMAWFDFEGQWHVRHADGTIEDFPDLLADRLAEFRRVTGVDLSQGHQGSADTW